MLALARHLSRQAAVHHMPPLAVGAGALLDSLRQLAPSGSDAACMQQRQYGRPARHTAARAAAAAAFDPDLVGEEETVMSLPDLDTLGRLNPRLREVMEQHEALQRSSSAADVMLGALEEASPGGKRARRVSRSALARLRVDALRGLVEQLGSDPRGSKDVLVDRLLDVVGSEAQQRAQQEAAAVAPAAGGKEDGVVSRRQLAAQALMASRLAAAAARGGSYGLPESSLRESQRELVQQAEFAHIFTPEEVADIFADARAQDIAIIDVRGVCPFTDWMVLATARSQRLAHMLAAGVLHALKARAREVAPGVAPVIEGALTDSEWLVVDAGSVVAHVFLEGYREQYDLEELWGGPDGRNVRRVAPKQTVHTLDTLGA